MLVPPHTGAPLRGAVPPHAKCMFQGVRHSIWQWEQTLFDGSTTTFEAMVREDTVAIIPFLDADTILLIKEEQPGREAPFFDVPGGCVDPGETAEDAARRELVEETGYRAERIRPFRTKRFLGMTRFEEHVVLATGLADGEGPHMDPGEKINLHPTAWKEAVAMCLRSDLRRLEAMLAILALEFDPDARKMKDDFLSGL